MTNVIDEILLPAFDFTGARCSMSVSEAYDPYMETLYEDGQRFRFKIFNKKARIVHKCDAESCKHYRDGTAASRAVQPTHVPGLLEDHGLDERDTAKQYCKAIHDFCLPADHPDWIDEKKLWSILSNRKLIG